MKIAPLGPINGAYYLDNHEIAVIEGPVGSAKTTASCLRLQRHAYEQVPGTNGIAMTRWAVVRETKKQLLDTTLKTWLTIFPQSSYGEMVGMNHHWRFTPQGFDHPIDSEFMFRALDDPDDVSDLLSLEVTGFYCNEVRDMNREIVGHFRARTRFLSGDRPSTWRGWIGDTNPWDVDHWLQEMCITSKHPSLAYFKQPGGMEPDAENLENLEQTAETLELPYDDPRRREQGRTYYVKLLDDYTRDDAEVYVHAKRARTKSGKPIYTEYRDSVHCVAFELVPSLPLFLGFDFGRTPACVIAQKRLNGNWRVRYELCAEDMGILDFGHRVAAFIEEKCPNYTIAAATGDPSGNIRDGKDETAFDLLQAAKILCKGAHTNEPSIRVEVVQQAFKRMADGEPGLIIHPDCKVLSKACNDGYHLKKLKVVGERYSDEPDKNKYSHVAEALQYLLLGGGEARVIMPLKRRTGGPRYAES
jgi:hypothetical protein